MRRKNIRAWVAILGISTLVGMGGLGIALITGVQQRPIVDLFAGPIVTPVLLGVVCGIGFGMGAWALLLLPRYANIRLRYAARLGPLLIHRFDRWAIAVCAGVGEELLFRGAIQHWLGIPLTAIFFVAIHGYLDPRDRYLFLYGVVLTVFMYLIGIAAHQWGLVAPMIAHTIFDIILLDRLARDHREMMDPQEG